MMRLATQPLREFSHRFRARIPTEFLYTHVALTLHERFTGFSSAISGWLLACTLLRRGIQA